MKMKLAVAFAVLFFATIARADSTEVTVDITVTSCVCDGDNPSTVPINMTAQLIVEPEMGTWFFPGEYYTWTGIEDEVISITGNINGYAITFLQPPIGDGSWISPSGNTGDWGLGYIYFSANGSPSWMFNDVENYLEGFGGNSTIGYE